MTSGNTERPLHGPRTVLGGSGGAYPSATPTPAPIAAHLAVPPPPVGIPGVPLPGPAALATLAYAYRRRQTAIASHATRSVGALWDQHVVPAEAARGWAAIRPVVFRLVSGHFAAAAADAARFYLNARVLADLGVTHVPQVELAEEELSKSLDSMSMGTFFHQLEMVDAEEAHAIAHRSLEAATGRLTLKGGRQTISEASVTDPAALGWERVISAGACSFCAMLASRGGVYGEHSVEFRAHDHCNCTAEPVFRGQKPAGQDLHEAWQRVTAGKSGSAALSAWESYWSAHNEQSDHGTAEEAQAAGPGHAAEQQQ